MSNTKTATKLTQSEKELRARRAAKREALRLYRLEKRNEINKLLGYSLETRYAEGK